MTPCSLIDFLQLIDNQKNRCFFVNDMVTAPMPFYKTTDVYTSLIKLFYCLLKDRLKLLFGSRRI